jgi:uncharacterized protein
MKKQVKVKLNSKQQSIVEEADESLTVHLKSLPVDGKANDELVKLLAKKYAVPKSRITIQIGISSRTKLVDIDLDS